MADGSQMLQFDIFRPRHGIMTNVRITVFFSEDGLRIMNDPRTRIMSGDGNFGHSPHPFQQVRETFLWSQKTTATHSSFHILRLRKNCEENRMICEWFFSDYRDIFEAEPRKSRDNHSKTSNRSSCVPNSLFEKS